MSSEVRFETKIVGQNPRTGVEQIMPGLVTPLDDVPAGFDEILIDGTPQGVSQLFSERFSHAVATTQQATEIGATVDCVAFGVLMSGGTFVPYTPEDERDFVRTNQVISFKGFGQVGEADITEALRPAALGVRYRRPGNSSRLYMPIHTIVKIDEGSDLFIQKVGAGDIAIGDIETSNTCFAAPFVGTIMHLEFIAQDGSTVMRYSESGWMLSEPAWTFKSYADDPLN